MSNLPIYNFIRKLPKCEHHVHLEGCLSPDLVFRLAKKNGITLPSDDAAYTTPSTLLASYEHFGCLDDFLRYYYIAVSVLIEASDFEALAYEYFSIAHSQGVHHAEVFFDPQTHTSRGISYDVVVSGFSAACERANRDFGMSTNLIMCFLRHLPSEAAHETFAEALKRNDFENGIVAGVGLDSSEVDFPPELFQEVYKLAAEKGIRRTGHAGEEGDPSYIRSGLDNLSLQRIDHGIRLVEDKELMKRVAEENIMLTMCPLSNLKLRCVNSIAELPVREFLEAGVPFSINCDDPAYFGGYTLENYFAIQKHFNLTVKEWVFIANAAINGSWISGKRKEELLSSVQKCVKEYTAEIQQPKTLETAVEVQA
ncbi:adenine deaminase Dea2 [Schizosaccharomyces pombe]|uniref:Adenine deaminase n=1 Tax=Schizosaccharomyces pombe (strain 972 / ATCC 24843) TaxID=284812 RepID=ADE_SCHPO|nr:adenine deaminase Dea2 [Schizosaccharomyces pombe]Q9P6I7.1 RecName: Full=Adenine deaminase; Short=ADE; AltName: Full=Adenine aminohydrolase; Short=AAH [Schizosaccharomyces pombe 972h-]CAB91177.1 adenine deaminase Dea2 [Schizosaccharomyces pombe]|eukprot:NP_595071.1 adenine deaminase Dea2 [Schizosaccharomyces pombe]